MQWLKSGWIQSGDKNVYELKTVHKHQVLFVMARSKLHSQQEKEDTINQVLGDDKSD